MELEAIALNMLGLMTPLLAITAFLIPLLPRLVKNRESTPFMLTLIAGAYAVLATTTVLVSVTSSEKPMVYMYGGWPPHFGIVYEVDQFNGLIGALTAWIMLTIILYSKWYSAHLDDASWYYTMLVGLETGILGCLYTGDAFNLFVMIEVLSISAYGLVAYHRDRAEAVEAAAKYALIGAVATTIYFLAVVLLYAGYGTVNMALLSSLARHRAVSSGLKYVGLMSVALALWVFTYKSAIFPNHFWLPDAHPEAPTPVSAALSGLVVNVGAYAVARFLYTMFPHGSAVSEYRELILLALFILGAVSGIVGALMMMMQRDIKRLLAYSTISHMGIVYMALAAGFMSNNYEAVRLAVMGGLIHIVSHGVAKAMLFMTSGIFIDAAGTRDLDSMKGVGRLYPLASASMVIGFFSLAGLLPLLGFYSKLLIALGYFSGGFSIAPILIIVISALSLPGYLKAISSIVFGTGSGYKKLRTTWVEVMLFAMALFLVVAGVIFWLASPVFESATLDLVLNFDNYVKAALSKIPGELEGWLP